MAKKDKNPAPDLVVAQNNNVHAVYVVNPWVLAREGKDHHGRSKRGRPLLFYTGNTDHGVPGNKVNGSPYNGNAVYPYCGREFELGQLLEGRVVGSRHLPETVQVNGVDVRTEELWSGYAPFSFCVGHEHDYERCTQTFGKNIRTDLTIVQDLFKQYDEKVVRESKLGFRFLRALGLQ